MRIYLYVVELRKTRVEPERPLSEADQLAGWRANTGRRWLKDEKRWEEFPAVINEGHQRGELHTLTAPHVVTWHPAAGDHVVAAIRVEFTREHPEDWFFSSASYSQRVHAPDNTAFGIRVETVLGRAVMLGEDDADAAFGGDALRDAVEHALWDDWRPSFGEIHLRTFSAEEEWTDPVHVARGDNPPLNTEEYPL